MIVVVIVAVIVITVCVCVVIIYTIYKKYYRVSHFFFALFLYIKLPALVFFFISNNNNIIMTIYNMRILLSIIYKNTYEK